MATSALVMVNGFPRMQSITASQPTIYDQTVTISSGGLTAGTALTLPSSQTYNSTELLVMLNGQVLAPSIDFNYVGSVPRTQITFVNNLVQGDKVRFYIGRAY